MLINISEFAKNRNVDRVAVNAWIRNHPEVDKACKKQGKEKVIDTTSPEYELLEKQYPLPSPIEVIQDTESQRKLVQALEVINQLREKMETTNTQLAQAEAIKLLLEDKESQLEKTEQRLEKTEKQLESKESALEKERQDKDVLSKELAEAQEKIRMLESRGFWERLLNKKI